MRLSNIRTDILMDLLQMYSPLADCGIAKQSFAQRFKEDYYVWNSRIYRFAAGSADSA